MHLNNLFFLPLLLLSVSGYGAQPRDRFSCPGCNVILVSLDDLRADSLGIYGYDRATSPNLDRLARGGAVFLNAFAQAPNTLPSHMSIFTSQYPWTHRVETVLKDKLAPATVTLPMVMDKHGYRTVWAGPPRSRYLSLTAGFEKGFMEFASSPIRSESLEAGTWETAFAWLGKNRDRKFFMFLHTGRIHEPFTPQEASVLRFSGPHRPSGTVDRKELYSRAMEKIAADPALIFSEDIINRNAGIFTDTDRQRKERGLYALMVREGLYPAAIRIMSDLFRESFNPDSPRDMKRLRLLYDAGVYEADAAVGALYAKLTELGLAEKTLLVLTADHGEEFMEHGQRGHNQLYLEHLRVPLIFVFPGKKAGTREARPAQSIDITPTILDIVGLPPLKGAQGRSLRPPVEDPDIAGPSRLAFAGWNGDYAVRDARYTYIRKSRCTNPLLNWEMECVKEEFYDRASDPGERKDIFSSSGARAAEFEKHLAAALKSAGKRGEGRWPEGISEETKRKIRETGYW